MWHFKPKNYKSSVFGKLATYLAYLCLILTYQMGCLLFALVCSQFSMTDNSVWQPLTPRPMLMKTGTFVIFLWWPLWPGHQVLAPNYIPLCASLLWVLQEIPCSYVARGWTTDLLSPRCTRNPLAAFTEVRTSGTGSLPLTWYCKLFLKKR